MTEHEKLKEICDKIGYKYRDDDLYYYDWDNFVHDWNQELRKLDVREIIFTQEFMDAYNYHRNTWKIYTDIIEPWIWLMDNLDNPVDYLAELIWLNK